MADRRIVHLKNVTYGEEYRSGRFPVVAARVVRKGKFENAFNSATNYPSYKNIRAEEDIRLERRMDECGIVDVLLNDFLYQLLDFAEGVGPQPADIEFSKVMSGEAELSDYIPKESISEYKARQIIEDFNKAQQQGRVA